MNSWSRNYLSTTISTSRSENSAGPIPSLQRMIIPVAVVLVTMPEFPIHDVSTPPMDQQFQTSRVVADEPRT